jgi:glucan phosphoethanolaminetransferase (alkaline phosphatase superfamily)
MRPRINWFRHLNHNLMPPAFALVALLTPSAISIFHSGVSPLELTQASESSPELAVGQLPLFSFGLTFAVVSIAMLIYRWRPTRLFLHLALFTVLVELFYRIIYHGPVTVSIMFAIIGTSPREAGELLGAHPLLTGSLLLIALLVTYTSITSWQVQNPFRTAWCVGVGATAALLLSVSLTFTWWQINSIWTLKQVVRAEVTQSFPFDFGNSILKAIGYSVSTNQYAAARAAFAFQNVRMLAVDSRAAGSEIYVIIVGESSRRSNWSLFGYPRSTTPKLDAIRSELVILDHVASNATVTALSVAQALTRASPTSWWKASSEKSIIALLRQAGFSVHWISNQRRFGAYAGLISTIALEANSASYTEELPQSIRTDRYDSNLLTRMDEVLDAPSGNGKRVIFLHMMGSHLNYADRYPSKFDVFHESADAPRNLPDGQIQVVNQYDNSLRFTDHIVRSVIEKLERCHCKAAMIYFSDHGERLFDSEDESGADFGHGYSTISREEIAIPFIVWMSSQYQAANPSLVATLRDNSQVPAQLHNLFETVVDLTGVDYGDRADSLSLFSKNLQAPRSLEFLSISEHPVSLPVKFGDSLYARPVVGVDEANTRHVSAAR